ncbi:PTS system oligo-beta-mannoside-specific EIIC component [Mycobacteroides abscessus subsp. abscessus]|nr:PTS system oligo-beta-mannoside-specific EIIC component [Mycobacteroides abscessus subsp. abscessus]
MEKQKPSFLEKISNFVVDRLAGPMAKFGGIPAVAAVKDGLVAIVPIVIIGSLFLLIAMLGLPGTFSENALIPALSSFSPKLLVFFNITMNFLSLYAAVAIGMNYAKHFNIDSINAALLSVAAFFLININDLSNGMDVTNFAAGGLFAAIISSLISIRIYRFFLEKRITIKMPDGVPPNVANAFVALIPFFVIFTLLWVVRSILNFDITAFLNTVLGPVFSGTDSIFVYVPRVFIGLLLWSVGMHGDNMIGPIFEPLKLQWVAENAEALASGVDLKDLPHVWTTVVERITVWPAAAWGILFWMWRSKLKQARTMAGIATPAAVFTIIEPIVFGLPIVLNPFFIIPFIISGTIAAIVTYGAFSLHLINRVFVELPWATPPFISGYVATGGDWKGVLMVFINFAIGIIVYYPFWKAYEKAERQKESMENKSVDSNSTLSV